jgi:hypothetical protein
MDKSLTFAARPGNLGLSILAFAGLTLLAAALWPVAPGYVLLLFVPALALCFYQMVLTPIYGLRLGPRNWTVMTEDGDREIHPEQIAYLRIVETGTRASAALVLRDGTEVGIPFDLSPKPLDLIRAATERGIPVRSC